MERQYKTKCCYTCQDYIRIGKIEICNHWMVEIDTESNPHIGCVGWRAQYDSVDGRRAKNLQ